MTTATDTVVDRIERVKHSISGQGDPQTVQVAVDGPCPNGDCEGRIVVTIRADTTRITCPDCGHTFSV